MFSGGFRAPGCQDGRPRDGRERGGRQQPLPGLVPRYSVLEAVTWVRSGGRAGCPGWDGVGGRLWGCERGWEQWAQQEPPPGRGSLLGGISTTELWPSRQMETGQKEGAGLFSLMCVCFSSGSARCAASAAGQTDLMAEIAAGRQERAQVSLAFFVSLSADRLAALPCEKGLWEGPAVGEGFCLVIC